MQRSTTSAAATVHSVLLKPTIYETFVGKTSATARSTTASPSSINPSPSSPRFSDSSSGIITKTSSYSAKTASAVSAKSQSVTRTLCTVAAPTRRTRTLFTNRNFEGRQRRTMASTQPLTQSTLPTAEELKIETPINEIQTAPGVTLNDHKSLLVASVLDLFAGKPSLRKLSLWKPDAIFKDPLTTAEGHKQYAAQWYGLAAGFSEITRLSHTVTSAGNPITLDLKTKYVVKGIGAEKTVASIVEIWVDENGSGKIEKVQDKWDGEINEGPFKQALRKMNAVGVPIMVSVPKSIEEEEGKKK